jgi:hypothetical protein
MHQLVQVQFTVIAVARHLLVVVFEPVMGWHDMRIKTVVIGACRSRSARSSRGMARVVAGSVERF